jgi:hypothetical protein
MSEKPTDVSELFAQRAAASRYSAAVSFVVGSNLAPPDTNQLGDFIDIQGTVVASTGGRDNNKNTLHSLLVYSSSQEVLVKHSSGSRGKLSTFTDPEAFNSNTPQKTVLLMKYHLIIMVL